MPTSCSYTTRQRSIQHARILSTIWYLLRRAGQGRATAVRSRRKDTTQACKHHVTLRLQLSSSS